MKVEFSNIKGNKLKPSLYKDGRFTFTASRAIIIQASEIMKVQTDLIVRVPYGFVLNISTSPDLSKKVGELFPGHLAISYFDNDFLLELPVRNGGRNPLHIMQDQVLAFGFLSKTLAVEVGEFSIIPENSSKKSTPPKKNPDIKFEIN